MPTAFLRPDADESDGNWTNEAGSNTNLFASIDESSLNDSDFIKSLSDDDKARFRLSDPGAAIGSPAVVRYRCKSGSDTNLALVGRLYQGTGPGTLVAQWETGLTTSFATYTHDLSAAELALISNADDLYLEFEKVAEAPHLLSQIDLNFVTADYYPSPAVTDYLSISRASTGYATNADGTLTSFGTDTLRITDLGLLIEGARTNEVLWNRDLTNAAWTPTNITAAKDQTGPDGVSNSASKITASAGNGTILQAITLASSARFQSAYVKRITGSGTINMTMDNGATWTAITVTASWALATIPTQTLANPTVGFRIVTSGDAIAVDFVQNENGIFASSPVPTTTTSFARAADAVMLAGDLNTVLSADDASIVMDAKFATLLPGVGFVFLGKAGINPIFIAVDNDATIIESPGPSIAATLGNSLTTVTGAKCGLAFSNAGRSLVGGGGTVSTDATDLGTRNENNNLMGTALGYNNVSYGLTRRLTVWSSRLADATLQALTAP